MSNTINVDYVDRFDLLRCQQQYSEEWMKLEKAMLTHGYRGISRGGKDGVFNILSSSKRPSQGDMRLYRVFEKLSQEIDNRGLTKGIPVKVVAHLPNGVRLVGLYFKEDNRVMILGLGNYDGEILV